MPHREHPLGGLLPVADAGRLSNFQQASIKGDKSLLTEMLQTLDKPTHEGYEYGLPHMLARLGATEALPILNTYILSDSESSLSNIAKAAKYRIIAEDSVKDMPGGKDKSRKKISVFLTSLNMTATDLNAALLIFQRPEVNAQGRMVIKSGARLRPLGVAAADEIADIVYHESYQDYQSLPEIAQLNFEADYPAALKMRLAPLTREQRMITMVDDLAGKTILRGETNFEIQLLANEGAPASEAAATKIRQMLTSRANFSGAGFGALIYVIAGVGDSRQLPFMEELEQDKDITTANCASIASIMLQQGSKRFTAWGY